MKKIFIHYALFFAPFVLIGLISCGDTGVENAAASLKKSNSPFYNDIIFSEGGEILGFNFGDSRSEVIEKLPQEAFDEQINSSLFYYWSTDDYDYDLELFFNSDNQLSAINASIIIYNQENKYDKAKSEELYKDLKRDFIKKYGSSEELTEESNKYITWISDEKEAELGIDDIGIYWYITSYD